MKTSLFLWTCDPWSTLEVGNPASQPAQIAFGAAERRQPGKQFQKIATMHDLVQVKLIH
jgi:hypothetical protein